MRTNASLREMAWKGVIVATCFICLSLPVMASNKHDKVNDFDGRRLPPFTSQHSNFDLWQGLKRFDEASGRHDSTDRFAVSETSRSTSVSFECEENYGFLPCSTNIAGNVFLLVVYGFLMLKAAQLLSNGSEQLLTVLDPGVIGGLLLPILGSLPDALVILVSGLGARQDEAQAQVLVGMGLLAGSTIMLLTLLWGTCLILGRCDLYEVNGHVTAKERTLTRGFNLIDTGVTTDSQTRSAAWIMVLTVIPYILAQLPRIINKPSLGTLLVVISCVFAFAALLSYCVYQIMSPWIQQRRIYLARYMYRRSHAIHRLSVYSNEQTWGNLLKDDGAPNEEVISKLFGYFDRNDDDQLSAIELKGLIVGLGISHGRYIPEEEEVENWMQHFDVSRDGYISQMEFCEGLRKWTNDFKPRSRSKNGEAGLVSWDIEARDAHTALAALLDDQEEDEEEEATHQPSRVQVVTCAILLILGGTILAAILADPLVDTIHNFSKASGIPSFFISFVATPIATNSSEAISSLMFSSRKRKKNISLTYSQIYGAVAMNNTLCLGIFLAIVAARGLTWDFSAEVTVIFLVILIMGLLSGFQTTFRAWMALIALSLYPIAIGVVAVLDYVFGWE